MVGREATPQVPDPFEVFYRREYAAMVALAYAMTGNSQAAEEVAQDAFLKAHRNWSNVESMASPGGWLRVVTMNLARSRWRRLKLEVSSMLRLDQRPAYEDDHSAAEAHEFWTMVRRLPTRQAQVLALHYVEDHPVRDIAELLGIAEGTVKASMHQARERLGRKLESEGWVADGV